MIVVRKDIGVGIRRVQKVQVHRPEVQKVARRERKEVAKEDFSNVQVWLLPCWPQHQANCCHHVRMP